MREDHLKSREELEREVEVMAERIASLSAAVLRLGSSLELATVLQEAADSALALSRHAQEAHEAIRPTDFSRTPDSLAGRIAGDAAELYALIWQRAVTSQMAAARLDRVRVGLATEAGDIALAATGSRTVLDGFLRDWREGGGEDGDEDDADIAGERAFVSEVSPSGASPARRALHRGGAGAKASCRTVARSRLEPSRSTAALSVAMRSPRTSISRSSSSQLFNRSSPIAVAESAGRRRLPKAPVTGAGRRNSSCEIFSISLELSLLCPIYTQLSHNCPAICSGLSRSSAIDTTDLRGSRWNSKDRTRRLATQSCRWPTATGPGYDRNRAEPGFMRRF